MKLNPQEIIDLFKKYGNWDKTLGLKMCLDEHNSMYYELLIEEKHLSRPATSHGGVIAAMMDSVLGITSLQEATSRGMLCSTVEFKINFLRPALKGHRLRGKAKIDFSGKSLLVTSAEIQIIGNESTKKNLNPQETLILAKGQGTFNLYIPDDEEFSDFNR